MSTNEKWRLFAEGLQEHQEKQVEIFISMGRILAVLFVLSLVAYTLYYFKIPQRIYAGIQEIFGRKNTQNRLKK